MEQRTEHKDSYCQKVVNHNGQKLESRWMSRKRMEKLISSTPGLPIYTLGYRNPEKTSEFKGLLVRTCHGIYIFREREVTAQTKAAVLTDIKEDPRTTVGITEDEETILFFSKHYDNEGNVFGPWVKLTDDKSGFYLSSYSYDNQALNELGWSHKLQNEIHDKVKDFISNHK